MRKRWYGMHWFRFYRACQCSKLPSHYFPISTNQLAVLLAEYWTTNQISTKWGIFITIEDNSNVNLPYWFQQCSANKTQNLSQSPENQKLDHTFQWIRGKGDFNHQLYALVTNMILTTSILWFNNFNNLIILISEIYTVLLY